MDLKVPGIRVSSDTHNQHLQSVTMGNAGKGVTSFLINKNVLPLAQTHKRILGERSASGSGGISGQMDAQIKGLIKGQKMVQQ